MCLRGLLLQVDCTPFVKQLVKGYYSADSPRIEPKDLVQMMRGVCGDDEQFTIDQLYGIVEMLKTHWMKADADSDRLAYSKGPTIYNALLYFVDQGTLELKDNTQVVCHWQDILRWHTLSSAIGEDLLVCAFLAAYDLNNVPDPTRRNDFAWPSYIRTDDPVLETMLEMPLADIHAHLKGSSLNFDINWICLMNHITGRKTQFDEIAGFVQGHHHQGNDSTGLYQKAVVAAAIRLYLAQLEAKSPVYTKKELSGLMRKFPDSTILDEASKLQQSIETALQTCGKQYVNDQTGDAERFDYAIREGVTVPRGKQEMCAYSLLSGERHILYSTLRGIYLGDYSDGCVATLLYIYLLIKDEIRHEISQLNDTVGFANFSIYEERKLIFAKPYPAYKKAAIHLAVASFFSDHPEGSRYHETRITPEVRNKENGKDALELNIEEIDFNDRAIEDSMFKTIANKTPWAYRYIYHFIKERDNTEDQLLGVKPRHYVLRDRVKEQAQGIWELRNSSQRSSWGEFYADRIVGIDAANSEIACRPEVFAQAFRYLKRHQILQKQIHCPTDLGITYHVGEDFMDVVDGLRAVDEAIRFLQLQKRDRIGHGLVLGVDVDRYYEIRNHTVAMSLQMQMDNAVWLWHQMTRLGIHNSCKEELEQRYGDCFRRIYPNYGWTPDIDLYYSSMLLRGDNPECYEASGKINNPYKTATEWGTKMLVRSVECDNARKQKEACKLYYRYHYDKDGKLNGRVYDTWEVNAEMCQVVELVQRDLLQYVEKVGIAIECNPTSNYKIGEIDRYDCHPITKFNSIKRSVHSTTYDVSVSINTDDKGVFATSIEREYALVAHSLIRRFRLEGDELKDSDVYEWLDNIRLHSIGQRFDKKVHLEDPSEKKSLSKLKEQLRDENEKEILGRRFVERLRYGWHIIFGKRNG